MPSFPCIVKVFCDLRVQDNLALIEAARSKQPIIVVYIHSEMKTRKLGKASALWLSESLKAFSKELKSYGLQLIIKKGDVKKELESLIKETGATKIFFNKSYEPDQLKLDIDLSRELENLNVDVEMLKGNYLFEPWDLLNKQHKPFQVFTHFWKCAIERLDFAIEKTPSSFLGYTPSLASLTIEDLHLREGNESEDELLQNWTPGEKGAHAKLSHFLKNILFQYNETRDVPSINGTSLLSPHLHFGEISVQTVLSRIAKTIDCDLVRVLKKPSKDQLGIECFVREIGWREFAAHVLYQFPETVTKPLRRNFERFSWIDDKNGLLSWQKGMTGYPIVDAGMRQLEKTGWMHNRVRMIVGSFLVKHLLVPWQRGESWFWDTLFDADLANNILGWQWVQGCGADAAPYFRIFNPVLQGEKFDSDGLYVKRWIPELKNIPSAYIHKPWLAPEDILDRAKITLGIEYPYPVVEHEFARKRALASFKIMVDNQNAG